MASRSRSSQPKTACDPANAGRTVDKSLQDRKGDMIHIEELDRVLRENAGAELDVFMAIAKERNEYLAHLKDALLRADAEKLELYASKLCGFTNWPVIREAERKKYAKSNKKRD